MCQRTVEKKKNPIDQLRTEPKPSIGRPQKYANILMALDDHDLYTPASITWEAVIRGFIEDNPTAKQRVRITLSRLSRNHQFPRKGDGQVSLRGQAPTVGWWGHRWKNYAKPQMVAT